jgi:hypothetical protein
LSPLSRAELQLSRAELQSAWLPPQREGAPCVEC